MSSWNVCICTMSLISSTLITDVFVSWQVWLWPMWTPACLPIRPALLLSVSGNTCWTWFPPVRSPRQPTHGNNAIFLSTDTITITPLNINNSHAHYHSNPFYGLNASGLNGAGENQPPSFFFFPFFFFGTSQIFLLPSSSPELELSWDSRSIWDTRNMSNTVWVPFVRVTGVVQFYKLLQWCCLSLPVYLNLPVAPRGSHHKTHELPRLWSRQGGKNNDYYYTQ